MEAASNLTLLDVVYNGYRRMVEPYSLVFKRRQDGVAREYFYAWDRTGGHRGPGIKIFVWDKIREIKNTSEKFEPRYAVELSKAGELPSKTYFGSPFSGAGTARSVARARPFARYSGRTYVVQCSYCGKRFSRKKPGTRISKHKDRYGNDCYGRAGFYVYV